MADQGETVSSEPLPLSEDEKQVLELHDRLRQLQLEIALLDAQKNYVQAAASSVEGDKSVKEAQRELMDSRSRYVLRNEVVDSVLTANPILQAVHNGTKASPIERDLLPYLQDRDETSSTLAQQSTELRGLLDEIMEVESRSLRLSRQNVDLASQMLELAARANQRKTEAIGGDPAQAAEIQQLRAEVKTSRQRWRVLKGTASAIVAGSGVDWARDPELRDIVLDPESDGEV